MALFSAMPAMYLLPLQSNENSSLKLIAWLIKLNTVAKNSIILSAHDYFEFSQMWEGPPARVSRGQNTHICRYFVTIHEICICDKCAGDTRDMVTPACPGFPHSRAKEGNWGTEENAFLIKWAKNICRLRYRCNTSGWVKWGGSIRVQKKRNNSRRLWMLAECFTNDRDLDATEERREECTMEICDEDSEPGHQWVITWGLGHWQEVPGNIQKRSGSR